MQVALRCAVLCGAVSRVLLSSGTIALCCVVFSLRALAGIQPSCCHCKGLHTSKLRRGARAEAEHSGVLAFTEDKNKKRIKTGERRRNQKTPTLKRNPLSLVWGSGVFREQ